MSRSIETETIYVEYKETNESFDHSFGREKLSGFEIEKVQVFIPAINEWVELDNEKINNAAKRLIENEIGR